MICQRLDMEVHYVSQRGQRVKSTFSPWFGVCERRAELSRLGSTGNIPSKWVCSPLWEAKSITQLLWHLENPFTMIETIQLKPLQSLPFILKRSQCISHAVPLSSKKTLARVGRSRGLSRRLDGSNLHINTERMTAVQEKRHSARFSVTNIPPQKTDSLNLKRFEIRPVFPRWELVGGRRATRVFRYALPPAIRHRFNIAGGWAAADSPQTCSQALDYL